MFDEIHRFTCKRCGQTFACAHQTSTDSSWNRYAIHSYECKGHGPHGYEHDVLFRRIALNVLEEETKRRVRELLSGPDWTVYWDGTKQQIGEEIARIARENGAAILAKWLEAAIGQVISSIQFQRP